MGYNNIGIQWNDDKIKNKIFEVMNVLNIDRMPSAREMDTTTGSSALSNKIAKCGGFYKWANKLNLKVKNSETQTGKGFENVAMKILQNKGYIIKRMSVKYPFDLLINNKVSIDVKVGRAHWIKGTRWHTIGINKKFATCNLYMIFALNENDETEKTLIIPGVELKLTTLNFGKFSKYDKYINRWDLIDKYLKFYESLK